jgi:UDP-N-acetylglucosamine--N-acetylmuramyl-(pentapeptide) pyrophosphoryl-undecaprenol N-acetylglucosamine transferase
MSNLILVIAAGSGGHILPALTFATAWCARVAGRAISFIGSHKKLDATILKNSTNFVHAEFYYLINLPGLKFWRYPMFLFQLIRIFVHSYFLLRSQKPELVYSTGALLAIPVCIAARLLRIPVVLHELNAQPGKAILFLAPFATKILLTFESSKSFFKHNAVKCEVHSYPIRFSEQDKQLTKTAAYIELCELTGYHFSKSKRTFFVLGGSQGSQFLNEAIKIWILSLAQAERDGIQIIHQSGAAQAKELQKFYEGLHIPAFVFAYYHQLQTMYCVADLVVCRAGAGTLFELLFFNKKSVVIPLEGLADDHQLINAQLMAAEHPELFTVIRQGEVEGKMQKILLI